LACRSFAPLSFWLHVPLAAGPADGKLLLASASQDKNVRIWAVQQQGQPQEEPNGGGSGGLAGASLLTRYAPKPLISTQQHEYSATLESLLIGHEDWVHSVAWHPRVPAPEGSGSAGAGIGSTHQPPCLLSASMDRTMMIWRPDHATGGQVVDCWAACRPSKPGSRINTKASCYGLPLLAGP